MANNLNIHTSPVVIGGVGGSGTRLINQCVQQFGFFMGNDLNQATDNLWFTLLFKWKNILSCSDDEFNELVKIMSIAMTGCGELSPKQIEIINKLTSNNRASYPSDWLKSRASSLKSFKQTRNNLLWGWKEPNSHIILDRLVKCYPRMKYIHVIRNGLDMAFSDNQNQLNFWGENFLGKGFAFDARSSLKYWCRVHSRVISIGKKMGSDFLLLNYDEFCQTPKEGIKKLCAFFHLDYEEFADTILALIKPATSINRFKQKNLKIFNKEDIAYVKSLGFIVN